MKNILKALVKSVLIPLRLTAAPSARHAAIQKKIFKSGMTTFIILNEEMNDIVKIIQSIVKIIQSLVESGLLIKSVRKTIKNEAKEQKAGFLDTLGASLLGNLLTGKGMKAKILGRGKGIGKGIIREAEGAIATIKRRGTIRASQDF